MPSLLYTYLCSYACKNAQSSVCSAHIHRGYQVCGWENGLPVDISKSVETLCIATRGQFRGLLQMR
jgi:hypothetical protein